MVLHTAINIMMMIYYLDPQPTFKISIKLVV